MKTEFPQSLLINRIILRGPEMSCLFSYAHDKKSVSYDEFHSKFIPKQDPIFSKSNDEILKDALGFLVSCGVFQINRNSNSWQQRTFKLNEVYCEKKWSFELVLAHALKHQQEKRQAVLANIYTHAITYNLLHIQYADLVQLIERSPLGDLFNWNQEKIHFWTQLFHFIGLLTSLNGNGCLFVPHPKPIFEHIYSFIKRHGVSCISIRDWCDSWESEIASCLTNQNRLHQGYAQVLFILEKQEKIQLHYQDDSSRSVLVGTRRISEIRI
ncbi:MAG: hypothetical protein ACO1RX_08225 [Candidatus Sericytochromatia bacterium]